MKLYLRVTKDKYELPLAVADSAQELAVMVGTTKNVVQSCISKKHKGWKKIVIDDEEDD